MCVRFLEQSLSLLVKAIAGDRGRSEGAGLREKLCINRQQYRHSADFALNITQQNQQVDATLWFNEQ
jgi:hypothetical protein